MGRPLLLKYVDAVMMYESGMSIEQVGNKFGLTRQAMWDALRRRGTTFRRKDPQPFIEFDGLKYSLSKDGYYRAMWRQDKAHRAPILPQIMRRIAQKKKLLGSLIFCELDYNY